MEKYTHIGTYGVLVKDNKILLIQKARGPHKGKWDLPGGSIEFGEEPYKTLKREFAEETGITELDGRIRTAASYTIIYPYKEDQLEELHHIGIIYDVELKSDDFVLKTDRDDQDSLGANWISIEEIHNMEVTPFVKEIFKISKMNKRIEMIRDEERKYHEACYDNYQLFEAGSWLHKPVKTVMDTLTYFETHDRLTVLDLGCGVGRNSIPIAETLKSRSGKVVCVDLIESALDKLLSYSRQYGVSEYIETRVSDIGDYIIQEQQFDYIIAVSALEHLESELKLTQVLERMVRGTKERGIHCLIMNTNIEEIDMVTGTALEPLMELNMTIDEAKALLSKAYEGWEVKYTTIKPLQFNIERNGRNILLKGDCITYVVQRT